MSFLSGWSNSFKPPCNKFVTITSLSSLLENKITTEKLTQVFSKISSKNEKNIFWQKSFEKNFLLQLFNFFFAMEAEILESLSRRFSFGNFFVFPGTKQSLIENFRNLISEGPKQVKNVFFLFNKEANFEKQFPIIVKYFGLESLSCTIDLSSSYNERS